MPKLTKPLKRSKWLEWTQAHADGPDGSPRRATESLRQIGAYESYKTRGEEFQ